MSDTVLLVIDVGNTNVSLGLFDYQGDQATLSQHWRTATRQEHTSDEAAIVLLTLVDQCGRSVAEVTDIITCSVVPPLLPIWERACTKLFQRTPLVIGPGIRTGMPIRYENPREVGADRIVNSVAAIALYGTPVIAVDFGTAITFDCVSHKGEYLGGAIFPGLHISMEALFDRASMLHRVEVSRPKTVIGRTTTTALQSGLLYGYAGMADAMIERIREELGTEAQVVATGGLAQRVSHQTEHIHHVEPFLTLEGLRILFEKNRSNVSNDESEQQLP